MLVGPIPLGFMSLRLMRLGLVSLGFMPLTLITLMFMWIRLMSYNSCDSIKWCSTMYLYGININNVHEMQLFFAPSWNTLVIGLINIFVGFYVGF
jgi:hypothetical protein